MLVDILRKNKEWSESVKKDNPEFFSRLAKGQSPTYLWIGCVDSRVPPAQVCGLMPGEMLKHTNIANQVNPCDVSCSSVLSFGVGVLKVSQILVCGHYNCGGIAAAAGNQSVGSLDLWLHGIRETAHEHRETLARCRDQEERLKKLSELNVARQVFNVVRSRPVQEAWHSGQKLAVHGVIYDPAMGLLRDMGLTVRDSREIGESFRFSF